jgi:hypothetical protein
MKKFLQRRILGGRVPVWVALLVLLAAMYYFYRKKKNASETTTNPAAQAGSDPTQPYGYSSPDMFPYSGSGVYSPPSSSGSVGMNPTTTKAGTLSAHQIHEQHVAHEQHIGNTPHRNTITTTRMSPHQKHLLHVKHEQHLAAQK